MQRAHDVKQRCCRWLLGTHDRMGADDFSMKQDFLSIMLGVRRPTVTIVGCVTLELIEDTVSASRAARVRPQRRR